MYKIMLADDEGIVIDSLKFIIQKEFGDACEVEASKTGRGAIELAERIRPDIAVMDIHMPGINGIEAIRQIKERNPHIIFIIMTAYDKFSYAKEALNLGVFEYLNKPVERREFSRVLREAMAKIDQERSKRSHELEIQEKMEMVVPIIENGLVYDILFRENYSEDVENFKNLLEIDENYGFMAALVCGDEQEGNHLTNAVGSSVRMQQSYGRIREGLKQYLNCMVGSAMGNKIALFLPYSESKMDYKDRLELIDRARDVVRYLKGELNAQFRLGIGSVRKLEELPASYNEALEALIFTDGSVVHADDVPVKVHYEENYPVEIEKSLFGAIDKKDMSGALSSAGQFYDWMEQCYPDDIDDIKLKVIEFVLWAEHLVFDQGGGLYRFQSRKNYLSEVLSLTALSDIRKWFLDKIREACENAQSQKDEQSNSVVSRAKKYMEENYSKTDISLDEVSCLVDISPYYFSKLFKEETGKNFIDYLTSIRMEKARELLTSSGMSMKEICGAIGYSDPNYFSHTFKKNVGVTPTEYKERGGNL